MQSRTLWILAALTLANAGCNLILGNEDHPAQENSTDRDAGIDATSESMDAAREAGLRDATSTDATSTDAPADHPVADANPAEAGGPPDAEGDGGCTLGSVHACQSCNNDCATLPNVGATDVACTAGRCAYGCAADYADCADAGAGCTTHLGSATSCGGCGVSCGGATPVCAHSADGGAYACTSGCTSGQANCNGTCADLASDPANCGACGAPCALANATAGCTKSACVVSACAAGFADCDQKASTGCEVNLTNDLANCGGCGIPCSPANATGACVASSCTVISCKAGFFDCDKLASTGCEVNLTNDTNNCGACGSVCKLAHATSACSASGCVVVACAAGFADCDGLASNGCETDITQPANCGGCNKPGASTACSAAAPVCSASGCVSGCPASTPTLCSGTSCVNTTNDANNCSACGAACAISNATPTCASSACAVAKCNTGFADCNGRAADGCEVNTTSDTANCGGCSKPCAPPNATPLCSSSACAIASCTAGFANCDNSPANGCEVNTTNDVKNCSGCGKGCAFSNAAASCTASKCTMGACSAGFGDCNASSTDGCEVNTTSDVNNCGACKAACTFTNATASCVASKCTLASCKTGFLDCNANQADGCEASITNDPANCGSCGKVCSSANGKASCVSSSCAITCNAGFADCNASSTDGCEVNTTNDANHCGGCTSVCKLANASAVCTSSTCAVQLCNAGFADCDGKPANGCETNTTSDPQHCGSCVACGAISNGTPGCAGGKCTVQSCAAGFGDCDNSASNGCETSLLTSTANCGACGHSCLFPGSTCTNGICSTVILYTPIDFDSVFGLAVDRLNVYFDDEGIGLMKEPLNGGATTLLAPGAHASKSAVDSSSQFIYFSDSGTVSRVGTNGGQVVPVSQTTGLDAIGVALDDSNVYWTDTSLGIFQVHLSNFVQTQLVTGGQDLLSIVVDSTNVYFGDFSAGTIGRVPIGGGATTPFVSGRNEPQALAVDAKNVYWAEWDGQAIMQMSKTGGGAPIKLATTTGLPCGIAVDANNVYWTGDPLGQSTIGAGIFKVPIGGGSVTTLVPNPTGAPCDIVVDGTAVYWDGSGGFGVGVEKVAK